MNRMLISAAHKSSGKTVVSIGICAALKMRGLAVQPFKKGPDYIDPMWLSQASGRACRNLDLYLMEREDVVSTFVKNSSDINLVEGNKGLYDGLALDGSNSNAALAKLLDLPVVLVIDARGMTRGIAPLILGYQAFDKEINIAGVILNNLGGTRRETKLRAVIEHYTDVAVIGAIQHDERLAIVERHLGLMPSNEAGEASSRIAGIAAAVESQVDLGKLLALSTKPPLAAPAKAEVTSFPWREKVRIGIARDRAFGFYYADDLDALAAAGAEIIPFDTLNDTRLPEVDALYIGGGFPETCAKELEANASLRAEIKNAVVSGMPVYAECGGLLYLSRKITYQGRSYYMVGAIPGDVLMHDKPIGRGYVHLAENQQHPWPRPASLSEKLPPIQLSPAHPQEVGRGCKADKSATTTHSGRKDKREVGQAGILSQDKNSQNQPLIFAHEFHYSSLENLPPDTEFAYRVTRGHGINGKHDGLVLHNLLASYTHLRTIGSCYWAARFVAFIRHVKDGEEPLPRQAAL